MATKAVEKAPADTETEPASVKANAADTKVKPTDTEIEPTSAEVSTADTKVKPTGTKGWVYRCSCKKEYDKEDQLGGHLAHYKKDKNHRNLGLGPPSKPAGASSEAADSISEAAGDSESVSTTESAELYVSDRDAGKVKVKDKKSSGKKAAVDKAGRATTNIDEAAIIAVAPKEFKISSILLWQAQRQR
jgi:hypothetical protein